MKHIFKTILLSSAFVAALGTTAFAAETRKEYRAEVAPINAEISRINGELKSLRAENKAASELFKQIRAEKKAAGKLSVGSENWSDALSIRKDIKEIGTIVVSNDIKNLRSEAKTFVQAGDYDKALSIMESVLEKKNAQLSSLKAKNELWKRINSLLQSGVSEDKLFDESGSIKLEEIVTEEIKEVLAEAGIDMGNAETSGDAVNVVAAIEGMLMEDITANPDSAAVQNASLDAEEAIVVE